MLGAGLYVVSDAPPAPPFSLYNVFVGIKKCDLRDLIVTVLSQSVKRSVWAFTFKLSVIVL